MGCHKLVVGSALQYYSGSNVMFFISISSWVTGSQATELYLNTRGIIQTVVLCVETGLTTCRWPEQHPEE